MKLPQHLQPRRGVALIIVLALLVLAATLIVTFMTQVTLNRQVALSSVQQTGVDQLARSALEIIIGDLREEMAAGSTVTYHETGSTRSHPVFLPRADATIPPARVSNGAHLNLLKRSAYEAPFFSGADYSPTDGLARASQAPTNVPSANGRYIKPTRWEEPRLLSSALATGELPDWIFVTRSAAGRVENATIAATHIDDLKNPDGAHYLIGRFAYMIYDQGALLDINVAGNGLDDNTRRGRLHQADLSAIPGLSSPEALIQWRWPASGEDASATNGGLFDPQRAFLSPSEKPGDRAFLSRQELIAYAKANPSVFDADLSALAHLSTFSREKNAPSWSAPWVTTRTASGAPRFNQRFPLHRLGLLASEATSDEDRLAWFGLTRNSATGGWTYNHGAAGRIYPLDEIPDTREPDFFELLKAALPPATLGVFPDLTESANRPAQPELSEEARRDAQILQIGANLIDQYDTDSRPTDITCEFVAGGEGEFRNRVFGLENLPYLETVRGRFERNETAKTVSAFYLPVVKDPHAARRSGITQFRLQALGRAHLQLTRDGEPPLTSEPVVYSSAISPDPGVGAAAGQVGLEVAEATRRISAGSYQFEVPEGEGGGGEGGEENSGPDLAEYALSIPPRAPAATSGGVTFVLQYRDDDAEGGGQVWRPYAVWHEVTLPLEWATGAIPWVDSGADPDHFYRKQDPRTERAGVVRDGPAGTGTSRPVLNLPYRSTGEMSLAYRDAPFQSLLFFAEDPAEGDAALLDLFSIDGRAIMAGRLAPYYPVTLGAMVAGVQNDPYSLNADPLPAEAALLIGGAVSLPPRLPNRSHLGARLSVLPENLRSAGIRALADVTNTRTWNLLIDVIAQTGRIPPNTTQDSGKSLNAAFIVEGERRYWLHVAIDRFTGEIIAQELERVEE